MRSRAGSCTGPGTPRALPCNSRRSRTSATSRTGTRRADGGARRAGAAYGADGGVDVPERVARATCRSGRASTGRSAGFNPLHPGGKLDPVVDDSGTEDSARSTPTGSRRRRSGTRRIAVDSAELRRGDGARTSATCTAAGRPARLDQRRAGPSLGVFQKQSNLAGDDGALSRTGSRSGSSRPTRSSGSGRSSRTHLLLSGVLPIFALYASGYPSLALGLRLPSTAGSRATGAFFLPP